MPRTQAQANARAFLAAYRLSGDITAAAAAAKIDRSNHYQWLKASPGYKLAFEQCREELADDIEAGAIKRCREGVLEPVYYQGLKVGVVRRFDVGREMFLLRGMKPKVYGHKAEFTGAGGGPIRTAIEVTFVDPQPGE